MTPAQEAAAEPRGNMVDRLGARPGRIVVQVLHLTTRGPSWADDALKLLRLWGRCRQAKALPPRLGALLARWAALLLEYAPAYGVDAQSPPWALGALRRLAALDLADVASFNVRTWAKAPGTCAVLGRRSRCMTTYVTEYVDGRRTVSAPIGSGTFARLRRNIQRGLNRHRGQARRKRFREKIRSATRWSTTTRTTTSPSTSRTSSPTSSPTTRISSSTGRSRTAAR